MLSVITKDRAQGSLILGGVIAALLMTYSGNCLSSSQPRATYSRTNPFPSTNVPLIKLQPTVLCECIYLAYVPNINSKLDINDFIGITMELFDDNRARLSHFLFRVYDIKSIGWLDRAGIEGVLKAVYGVRRNATSVPTITESQAEAAKLVLDDIFQLSSASRSSSEADPDDNYDGAKLSFRQFESYRGSLQVLSAWITNVLVSLLESPSAHMLQLERKYSSTSEPEEVMSRYNISKLSCDSLRQLFYSHCGAQKAELSISRWLKWCNSYLSPMLASALFRAKARGFKVIWRFVDFADFCLVYGAGSLENRALALSKTFYLGHKSRLQQMQGLRSKESNPEQQAADELEDFLRQMRTMVFLLAQQYDGILTPKAKFSANFASPGSVRMKVEPEEDSQADQDDADLVDMSLDILEESTYLSNLVRDALAIIEQTAREGKEHPSLLVRHYVDLIIAQHSNLPGVRELSLTACCLFGIRPTSPHLEKEYVMEIMLRRQAVAPQTSMTPFGPVNTDWCIVSKEWWDSWRFFVGKMRQRPTQMSPNKADNQATEPGAIDNWGILKKTGAKQLIPGTTTGQHLEVIPPAVYAAVHYWYGGGPKIMRKVVPAGNGTELELFPLFLKVCTCDSSGKMRNDEKEYLFSKSATVAEMAQELGEVKFVELSKVRLWNYAQTHWREQYILSPEITLEAAALQDGQLILMEISLQNGTWPRSQLHSSLLEEADSGDTDDTVTSLSGKNVVKLNSGRVGLDNLGNTCYLNASMQALLHTTQLMDYFLGQTHMQHINVSNKHGHGGRLAYHFGRLATEAWSSPQRSISPRGFCYEVGSLNSQFAGNQQQDAQELLDFLLVGLSEDLNLVEDKPYTEMPDSDGRPESELADIWWENHQKRDLSVITSLFSGQFKSSTTCSCGHNSARYEPFTLLSVAIPEDIHRAMTVHVFTRGTSYGVQCRVGVLRSGTLQDIIDAILSRDFKPPLDGLESFPRFVAAEVVASRVKNLCPLSQPLNRVTDMDNIFFFEVAPEEPKKLFNNVVVKPEVEPVVITTKVVSEVVENAEEDAKEEDANEEDAKEEDANEEDSSKNKVADSNGGSQASEDVGAADIKEVKVEDEADGPTSLQGDSLQVVSEEKNDELTHSEARIAFVQRKIRLTEGGGVENFQICVFGLPIMEALPTQITGTELYSIVAKRVEGYLKGKVEALQAMTIGQVETDARESKNSESFTTGGIRSMRDDDAVGGTIPPMGFVLRYVTGGNQSACSCSKCPWLSRCRGCFIPQNDETISLIDGETLAIDWHMIVFEEMIDTGAIMKVHVHPSAGTGKTSYERRIPLSRCLEKFTESERLEGFVCAKCKSDETMKRNFKLWRLPPVLVVQLKRFQFDHTSRRKLNNHIDFPQEGLDLETFLAEVRQRKDGEHAAEIFPKKKSAFRDEIDAAIKEAVAKGDTTGGDLDGLPLTKEDGCTVYDLYAVVHHIGILGGGHYVTTVRESRKPHTKKFDTDSSLDATVGAESESPTSSDSDALSERWWLFNDGQVTSLLDNSEVSAASAYVLFYMRRDAREKTVSELFPQGNTFDKDRTKDFTPTLRGRGKGINERLHDVGRSGSKMIRRMTGAGKSLSSEDSDSNDAKSKKDGKQDCVVA